MMKKIKNEYLDWLKKKDFLKMPNFMTVLLTAFAPFIIYGAIIWIVNLIF